MGIIAEHYLSDSKVQDVATGCPAAALVSELPRQEKAVQDAFQKGTIATHEALATAQGLSHDSWAALAMLVGGLNLMRAMPDAKTNNLIRNQIIGSLRKLAAQEKIT